MLHANLRSLPSGQTHNFARDACAAHDIHNIIHVFISVRLFFDHTFAAAAHDDNSFFGEFFFDIASARGGKENFFKAGAGNAEACVGGVLENGVGHTQMADWRWEIADKAFTAICNPPSAIYFFFVASASWILPTSVSIVKGFFKVV